MMRIGPKDYISEESESSLWASIRDYLTPPDVLVMRTAGPKWNNAKLYGEFGALWFFLVTKDGSEEGAPALQPEWPSLCLDYRQKFGFDNGMIEPEWLLDMSGALRNERTRENRIKGIHKGSDGAWHS